MMVAKLVKIAKIPCFEWLSTTVVGGSNLVSVDVVCDCRIFGNVSIRSDFAAFVIFNIHQNSSPPLDFLLPFEAMLTFSESPKMWLSSTHHFDWPQLGTRTSTSWTSVKISDCFCCVFFTLFEHPKLCHRYHAFAVVDDPDIKTCTSTRRIERCMFELDHISVKRQNFRKTNIKTVPLTNGTHWPFQTCVIKSGLRRWHEYDVLTLSGLAQSCHMMVVKLVKIAKKSLI